MILLKRVFGLLRLGSLSLFVMVRSEKVDIGTDNPQGCSPVFVRLSLSFVYVKGEVDIFLYICGLVQFSYVENS